MAADQLAGNGQVVTNILSNQYVLFCPCLASINKQECFPGANERANDPR